MIDFKKEIEKYDFAGVDEDFMNLRHETSMVFKAFSNILKRLGLEQNKSNTQLEEIMEFIEDDKVRSEEINVKNEEISNLNNMLSMSENENSTLVRSFVSILDHIEDLYSFAQKAGGSWSSQLDIIWRNIGNELLSMGITRIEGERSQFNKSLHLAKDAKECPEAGDGTILEVLRCGYVYKSSVIRKAEVIVGRHQSAEINPHEAATKTVQSEAATGRIQPEASAGDRT